jgi:hypothetical protein
MEGRPRPSGRSYGFIDGGHATHRRMTLTMWQPSGQLETQTTTRCEAVAQLPIERAKGQVKATPLRPGRISGGRAE